MRSKKKPCRNWKLYVITDAEAAGKRPLAAVVQAAVEGGASVIQLRDKKARDEELVKTAERLLMITRPRGVPLIINDRVNVAKAAGADGVHLGQEDGSFEAARAALGEKAIIGRSTHSPEEALAAEAEGFDYVGIGPVFRTPTKPSTEPVGLELVRFASRRLSVPFVAIGGIDAGNLARVREAGAKSVAVVRAVMGAPDPRKAAEALVHNL
ncbi:MAG: thiamine phosphate synthase [Candidatus Omnitrophota bacterium]